VLSYLPFNISGAIIWRNSRDNLIIARFFWSQGRYYRHNRAHIHPEYLHSLYILDGTSTVVYVEQQDGDTHYQQQSPLLSNGPHSLVVKNALQNSAAYFVVIKGNDSPTVPSSSNSTFIPLTTSPTSPFSSASTLTTISPELQIPQSGICQWDRSAFTGLVMSVLDVGQRCILHSTEPQMRHQLLLLRTFPCWIGYRLSLWCCPYLLSFFFVHGDGRSGNLMTIFVFRCEHLLSYFIPSVKTMSFAVVPMMPANSNPLSVSSIENVFSSHYRVNYSSS